MMLNDDFNLISGNNVLLNSSNNAINILIEKETDNLRLNVLRMLSNNIKACIINNERILENNK